MLAWILGRGACPCLKVSLQAAQARCRSHEAGSCAGDGWPILSCLVECGQTIESPIRAPRPVHLQCESLYLIMALGVLDWDRADTSTC